MLALRNDYQSNSHLAGFLGSIGVTLPSVGGTKFEIGKSYSALDIFDGVNRFSVRVE